MSNPTVSLLLIQMKDLVDNAIRERCKELEEQIDRKETPTKFLVAPTLDEMADQLFATFPESNCRIRRIKTLRQIYNTGLRESKDADDRASNVLKF